MRRSSLITSFYVLLVFASGSVVGAFAHRLWNPIPVSTAPKTPEEYRKKYCDEMKTRLQLTNDQLTLLNTILDETRARYRELNERNKPAMKVIHDDQVTRIRALLTDQQRPEYEKMMQEREAKRRNRR